MAAPSIHGAGSHSIRGAGSHSIRGAGLHSIRGVGSLLTCLFVAAAPAATTPAFAASRIVIIGGEKSEGPAQHDYPNGVRVLEAMLAASPDVRAIAGMSVTAHPDGWPSDPAAFDDASTVVLYHDGLEKHPLVDASRRAQFERAMQQGAGLVALHQATTVPADDTNSRLQQWLGGARYGMFDRATEMVRLEPRRHAVTRGVAAFTYRDEFYPTIRFDTARAPVPLLTGKLHVEFREGRHLVLDRPTASTVAWAYERGDGGRSVGFSGAHYLASLDEPALRRLLLNAIFWTARLEVPRDGVRDALPADAARRSAKRPALAVASPRDTLTFHGDPQRTGWRSAEAELTHAAVTGPQFGLAWESSRFDAVGGHPPRVYASPLYVDALKLSAGPHAGRTFATIFAATSNGFVYAINASDAGPVPAGTILWRTALGEPCRLEPTPLDGVLTGVLSTPVIDRAAGRIYVASCDRQQRWQAYALDLSSGAIAPGWPVRLDEDALNAPGKNRNAGSGPRPPPKKFDYRVQRGALALSPDGATLYVTFGETITGWLVAVDTVRPGIGSAFATVAEPHHSSGGIWGAGGPALDAAGDVFVVTGTSFSGFVDQPHDWTQSVLKLSYAAGEGLTLRGTYTPFNYCETAKMDIDLGSGGITLLPEIANTLTPQLMTVGGKQGNVYLLDRANMPGRLDRRPPCSGDSSTDASLLASESQPQFGKRGPLNVFGPYSEKDAALDLARGRSVPAYFRADDGVNYLFVTGNTKSGHGSPASVAPSLARLQIVAKPGEAAWLRVDRLEQTLVLENPGSPVVTSNGSRDAIVWVLDENARRTAALAGDAAPRPVLYAFDARDLRLLWKSGAGELHTSGKYNEPAFARGSVFVGTDRIQAIGPKRRAAGVAQRESGGADTGGAATDRTATDRTATDRTATDRATTDRAATDSVGMHGAGSSPPGKPLDTLDGANIYTQRCAACHDNPQGRIPPKALFAERPVQDIVGVLTDGVMREFAQGLTAAQVRAVARHLAQPGSAR